jgi:Icc-related predicted phosphoesterase
MTDKPKDKLTLVALSDTHGHHREVTVPAGDVLVYAGDFMTCGRKFSEVRDFANWFIHQSHPVKVLVAGNHDIFMEHSEGTCLEQFIEMGGHGGFHYLRDRGVNIHGFKFWGSPYQPKFFNWAFNENRGADIKRHWDLIPNDTDVLITHGPPDGILDQAWPKSAIDDIQRFTERILSPSEHCGCEELRKAVDRISPKLHLFGHIHGSYGKLVTEDTEFYNCSIVNEQYNPANEPHVVELTKG